MGSSSNHLSTRMCKRGHTLDEMLTPSFCYSEHSPTGNVNASSLYAASPVSVLGLKELERSQYDG